MIILLRLCLFIVYKVAGEDSCTWPGPWQTHKLPPASSNAGIDSRGLRGARWIIRGQKELRAGSKFLDKSNKMVKSTASWTIYLSGTDMSSLSVCLFGSTPATSLVKAHSSHSFIETLIQFPRVVTFFFLRTVCNKGVGLLKGRAEKWLNEKKNRGDHYREVEGETRPPCDLRLEEAWKLTMINTINMGCWRQQASGGFTICCRERSQTPVTPAVWLLYVSQDAIKLQ